MLLCTAAVGLVGALLMFAGDMLLYYTPEDFSYNKNCSSAEKIQAIIDVMKNISPMRLMVGGMIGPVSAFLYCVGFYLLFLLKPVVGRLPKGIRIIVSGGWTNLISVIYYAAILFWM